MTDTTQPARIGPGLAVKSTEDTAALAVVAVAGELDLATEPQFSSEVSAVLNLSRRVLVLDLNGLTFVGSAGLKALVELQLRAQDLGARLRLVLGRSPTGRLLELTGLRATFTLYETVDEARAAA